MAGTQIEIDTGGLDLNLLNGCLFFCRSALRNIGLIMEVHKDPVLGQDKLLICVDGPLESFTHRLNTVAQFLPAFGGALTVATGNKDMRYPGILIKILQECMEHVKETDRIEKELKKGGTDFKILVAKIPPELNEVRNDPDCPEYIKIVVEELSIAIRLLHGLPQDYTLALIAADRASEIFLKGKIDVLKCNFPELVDKARDKRIVDIKQVRNLMNAHKARNKCQHEGEDIDFYEAVEHIKNIIEALTPKSNYRS